MKKFKKLIGERIYLSPRSLEDTELYTKWLNDMEVTDYTGRTSSVMTYDAEVKYLETRNLDMEPSFAIVTLEDDKLIGSISLENINTSNRTAVLGIFIGDENYLSSGYGSEAIMLLLDFGFKYANLNNIMLKVFDYNNLFQ